MDSRMYFVIFPLLLTLMAIIVPFFLKAEIPNPCKKSLVLKQTCSTVFLLNAVVAALMSNFTGYAFFMIIGFCFSWLGDFLLHVSGEKKFFIAGLLSFLVGHIFFTVAYCYVFKTLFPDKPLFTIGTVILYFVLLVGEMLSTSLLSKVTLGKMLVPCIFYAASLTAMALQALSLAATILGSNGIAVYPIFTAVMLVLGAVLFVTSDYTLSVLTFKEGVKKHGPLRQVNIWTYFFAQMFLSATIYLISICN